MSEPGTATPGAALVGGLPPPSGFAARHPLLWFTLPLVVWIGFIAWGSLAPPEDLPSLTFPLADKVEHSSVYALLGFLLLRDALRGRPARLKTWLIAVAVCALFGLYLECLQGLSGYRDFELFDALANTIGASIGASIWAIWTARHRIG